MAGLLRARRVSPARLSLLIVTAIWLLVIVPLSAMAAPYAAMVIDARSGEVLHARNADTRLHPASLTKMMTLYVVFQAVQRGEISMDTKVRISKHAASEPPSKLGLRAGQRIALRYLVRAAAVKSANDAATAIAEAISGSEAKFARRMNRTAKAMGMNRTTFKNAHGLTESGHLSTARDMTTLGRHLLYDYPQYYNLFSRRSTHAGVKKVNNTNRRLLNAYKGADGIKTGYTRAAGFNLVASAERGNERVIATVFGGRSTASRNARVAELLDMGFRRSPTHVAVRKPAAPSYTGDGRAAGKTIRLVTAVKKSLRPQLRPAPKQEEAPLLLAEADPKLKDGVDAALTEAKVQAAKAAATASVATAPPVTESTSEAVEAAVLVSLAQPAPKNAVKPQRRPETLVVARVPKPVEPEVVTRLSTSGGRHWGINVGRYTSRYKAEKVLLKTALSEMSTLDGSLRKVVHRKSGFDANFMGMSREQADLACRRLQARQVTCFMIGPS